jgi:hypothetical protein
MQLHTHATNIPVPIPLPSRLRLHKLRDTAMKYSSQSDAAAANSASSLAALRPSPGSAPSALQAGRVDKAAWERRRDGPDHPLDSALVQERQAKVELRLVVAAPGHAGAADRASHGRRPSAGVCTGTRPVPCPSADRAHAAGAYPGCASCGPKGWEALLKLSWGWSKPSFLPPQATATSLA